MGGLLMSEKFAWGNHRLEPIHLAGWGLHQNLRDAEIHCSQIADAHYENFLIAKSISAPAYTHNIAHTRYERTSNWMAEEPRFSNKVSLLA